jgi:hypothetical protein
LNTGCTTASRNRKWSYGWHLGIWARTWLNKLNLTFNSLLNSVFLVGSGGYASGGVVSLDGFAFRMTIIRKFFNGEGNLGILQRMDCHLWQNVLNTSFSIVAPRRAFSRGSRFNGQIYKAKRIEGVHKRRIYRPGDWVCRRGTDY